MQENRLSASGQRLPNGVICKPGNRADAERRRSDHEWEAQRERNVSDDGTLTFFWHAHTLTVLLLLICFLIYVALFEEANTDSTYNAKRGIAALVVIFILFGVTQTTDGPFKRPHPAFWRLIYCLSVVYELALIYLLFQSVDDARRLLRHLDSSLGVPLPEKDYASNCLLYDSSHPTNPFYNLMDKLDIYVLSHSLGWWLKTLAIRDVRMCLIQSVVFELLEMSLVHHLPNFAECWWDKWILDVLICNGIGIYVGRKTLAFLQRRQYRWRGLAKIETFRGKVKRCAQQFTPYSFIEFDWRPLESIGRFAAFIYMMTGNLLLELTGFYLKHILWIPSSHIFLIARMLFYITSGAVAFRETFQFIDDRQCKTFGRQTWMLQATIATEILIIAKFGPEILARPFQPYVVELWSAGGFILVVFLVWHFLIKPKICHEHKVD